MEKEKFYLDARGTDATDLSKMVRVYYDGKEQPADQPAYTNTAWDRLEGLPGWAEWTTAQAVAYITDNVTDLASAKTVLIAMAKMLIALRDFNMAHLDRERGD